MKTSYKVLIIGSGAAGYACADRLLEKGITDICIVTENRELSTSRCSGSDKQTYYKLDIASPGGDSVAKMADDLFAGGSVNGTDAYLEAANSLPCFMHLVELGVPFPKDEYGVYQGYRTDHDNTKRATSCGPLTSKYMTQKLEQRVLKADVPVVEKKVIKLAVSHNRCFGVYCLDKEKTEFIGAEYTVLCTGAPAGIYADSVYPQGFTGATGLAVEAGAELANFQEWQYGIASKGFRWNLSGSYQQVVPRYVSVDQNGNEYEFLSGKDDIFTKIFLKGYEWPFNCKKTAGSSQIDICVLDEISHGRRVFLDYTKNPENFDFSLLGEEAQTYLKSAGADGKTPVERLKQLNIKAYKLFSDNGTDLEKDRIEIGVCAQHNNGGIRVDEHGRTSVENLFCSGEASGRFGVCRPGGAALNDTQTGAVLISGYIASDNGGTEKSEFTEGPVLPVLSENSNVKSIDDRFGRKMSDYAGAIRNTAEIEKLIYELTELKNSFQAAVKISKEEEYGAYFSLWHTTLARLALCVTELASAENCGSRGGCICLNENGVIHENPEFTKYITVTDKKNVTFIPVNAVPRYECAFETLLKEEK